MASTHLPLPPDGTATRSTRNQLLTTSQPPGTPAPRSAHDAAVRADVWTPTDRDVRSRALTWVAARCSVRERHLLGVASVGEDVDGRVLVRRPSASGTPLPAALDRIGMLTRGVAVTLSLPLLDLAGAGAAGALDLGVVQPDDVLVDDSGAPVVVDQVPGAVLAGGGTGTRSPPDGVCGLLTAVRTVWDRVDPRDEHRAEVEAALLTARDGRTEAIADLVAVVTAAGPPRPVRWVPVPSVFDHLPPAAPPEAPGAGSAWVGMLAAVVGHLSGGLPVGGGRRLPVRLVLGGLALVVGLVVVGLVAPSVTAGGADGI